MGQYSLRATAVTAFNDPPTTRLTGEARDIQKDTYSPIDEYGSIELLRLSQIEGEEHNGRPVFDFAQRLDFSEVNCQIEMNGEIKESIPPEEANSDAPYYKYYGPAYIDCPGLSLEFIANTLYDTPGELVGMVDGVFHIEDTSSE